MAQVLLATDAQWLFDDVAAALCGDGTTVSRIHDAATLRAAVAAVDPDLVILDMQTGNMGGIAGSIDIRLEVGAGRMSPVPVLLLLDRTVDRWLAREAGAAGWLIKPLDPFRLRRAARALLAGEAWFEGEPAADEPGPAEPSETEESTPSEASATA